MTLSLGQSINRKKPLGFGGSDCGLRTKNDRQINSFPTLLSLSIKGRAVLCIVPKVTCGTQFAAFVLPHAVHCVRFGGRR